MSESEGSKWMNVYLKGGGQGQTNSSVLFVIIRIGCDMKWLYWILSQIIIAPCLTKNKHFNFNWWLAELLVGVIKLNIIKCSKLLTPHNCSSSKSKISSINQIIAGRLTHYLELFCKCPKKCWSYLFQSYPQYPNFMQTLSFLYYTTVWNSPVVWTF